MPWDVAFNHPDCGERQWAVVKISDGTKVACHPTQEAAMKHVKALYANYDGPQAEGAKRPPPQPTKEVTRDDVAKQFPSDADLWAQLSGSGGDMWNTLNSRLGAPKDGASFRGRLREALRSGKGAKWDKAVVKNVLDQYRKLIEERDRHIAKEVKKQNQSNRPQRPARAEDEGDDDAVEADKHYWWKYFTTDSSGIRDDIEEDFQQNKPNMANLKIGRYTSPEERKKREREYIADFHKARERWLKERKKKDPNPDRRPVKHVRISKASDEEENMRDLTVRGETYALGAESISDDGRQWIHVMPEATEARNGDWFFTIERADLEAYAEYIKANPDRIPVDYDHAGAGHRGGSSRAAGWFTGDAQVRDDGLWAEIRWTPKAKQEIKDGEYRFISPEFTFANKDKKTGLMTKAKELMASTLTNRPFFRQLNPVTADEEIAGLLEEIWVAADGEEFVLNREQQRVLLEALGAVWSGAFINDLPDSSFFYIEPGGEKDEDGKTTPRNLRHFPYKDGEGKVDLPHLRNAIARAPQANVPQAVKDRVQSSGRAILQRMSSAAAEADYLETAKQRIAEIAEERAGVGEPVATLPESEGEPEAITSEVEGEEEELEELAALVPEDGEVVAEDEGEEDDEAAEGAAKKKAAAPHKPAKHGKKPASDLELWESIPKYLEGRSKRFPVDSAVINARKTYDELNKKVQEAIKERQKALEKNKAGREHGGPGAKRMSRHEIGSGVIDEAFKGNKGMIADWDESIKELYEELKKARDNLAKAQKGAHASVEGALFDEDTDFTEFLYSEIDEEDEEEVEAAEREGTGFKRAVSREEIARNYPSDDEIDAKYSTNLDDWPGGITTGLWVVRQEEKRRKEKDARDKKIDAEYQRRLADYNRSKGIKPPRKAAKKVAHKSGGGGGGGAGSRLEETATGGDMNEDILSALGVPEHADEATILSAIQAKDEEIAELKTEIEGLQVKSDEAVELANRVADLEKQARKREVAIVLAEEVRTGRVAPVEVESLTRHYESNLDGLKELVNARPIGMFAKFDEIGSSEEGPGGNAEHKVLAEQLRASDPLDTESADLHLGALKVLADRGKASDYTAEEYMAALDEASKAA